MIKSIVRANSLEEALALLQDAPYTILAGGTDLLPQLRAGKSFSPQLLDLQALRPALAEISLQDDALCIGALCTHAQIQNDPLVQTWCPVLAAACRSVGAAQIRKRGTIAGNLVNASPAADTAPTLAAVGATAVLQHAAGSRSVAVEELACGPGRTCLQPGELLTALRIPLQGQPWRGDYQKVGPRSALQISVASAALLQHPQFGCRIACGSVGPTVQRARQCEALFSQRGQAKQAFAHALQTDISPIDDIRASAQYRRDVLCNLIYQCYLEKEA